MTGDLTRERLARLRKGLAGAPFDAIVLTEPESVLYATGYRSMPGQVFRSHRMAAVVTGDDLWLVCTAADAPAAAAAGIPADRLVPFGRFYVEGPDEELTRMADRHTDLESALRAALGQLPPGMRVVREPETDVAAEARMIKLPAEVALLRRAARLCEDAVGKALGAARPGITERELAAVVAATMAEGGADPRFVVASVGERSALADVVPGDRAWQPGEIARFDVGCVIDGYWSDIGRTAVLGEPDERQRRVYAAVHAGEQAQLDAARPGITAEEMFRLGLEATAARVPRYRRQHCGHGIGLSIYEPPILAPGGTTPLRAGMTFCFETPYYELGWGGMMIEDTVVITEDGYEMLCSGERELLVVPA
ncbi:M24 family metallopeptidase [Paractinoplanes brasiliensis]|uniref:Xaa-Pro aminopeptidase n=1 Tax=Paractinoplanes brasiliensis TaxID=52695 RepID=A0A4R6J9X9_9ACTN|nr:Xaa-Pro peptidase family protein [Actinoplanes brasiliensis]TDO31711.1 Xaa-Pro aminopeptidase [Actinoplanes brasiliensis]GID30695.1 integrase [Actinoplanes brasiliensis]